MVRFSLFPVPAEEMEASERAVHNAPEGMSMADSQVMWYVKTIGLVIGAAVLTAVLTTLVQVLIWGQSNSGVSGGAATGVAVAVMMARRKREIPQRPPAP